MSQTEFMGLMNLHDVFLNASLLRKSMNASPMPSDPDEFDTSDRGRYERMWAAQLYVLVESWASKDMKSTKEYIMTLSDISDLEQAISRGEQNGDIEKLRQVRHYMSHRDKREYWDIGRSSTFVQLDYNEELHMAFSSVLLRAFNKHEAGKSG